LVAAFSTERLTIYTVVDLYVLGCTALTAILLALVPILPSALSTLVTVYASLRVIDTLAYQLAVVLVDSQQPDWKVASVRRSFLLALVNLAELVLAFAILYLTVGHVVSTRDQQSTPIRGPLQALSFSAGYMVTAGGGEFIAHDDLTRALVICQLASQALYILAILPSIVSNFAIKLGGRESDA